MMNMILDNATLLGLLFFFAFFVAMVMWVYRPSAKKEYTEKSMIPLRQDETHVRR